MRNEKEEIYVEKEVQMKIRITDKWKQKKEYTNDEEDEKYCV